MIPDERQFLIIDQNKDEAIGVLDEAFVAEYAEPGRKFIVRGSPWQMTSIRSDRIYVKSVKDPTGSIPSWVGEEIPVPFEIGQEVGAIRRLVLDGVESGKDENEIAERLCQDYPVDSETMKRAISETVEQSRRGFAMPTDRRITVEEWDDYVIINAHLGLLVNRTLARLIGNALSEDLGTTVGVQQDAYRIMIQTSHAANAVRVADIMLSLAEADIGKLALESSRKSGLFKRRLVHVARRFGAITKYANFESVSLRQLMRSFEGTVIMEEAFKETLEKDLDVTNTAKVLRELNHSIELITVATATSPSPITTIGIERISRKSDLIPSDKMKRIILESTKARLLNESRTLVCPRCFDFAEIMRIRDMPDKFNCPKCHLGKLGITTETPDAIEKISKKKGRHLSERENRLVKEIKDSSLLLKKYGKVVAYIFGGRRVTAADARSVLRRTHNPSDRLFEAVMEQEKKILKRRFL